MRRLFAVGIVLLSSGGCAIRDRMDTMNTQIATTNAQLAEANQRLSHIESEIGVTNGKLNTVEQSILQRPMLRPTPNVAPPVPGVSAPQPQ